MSIYREQLEAYLKTISIKCENVLDIGGGNLLVKNRVKDWDVNHYEVWDKKTETQEEDIKKKCDRYWGYFDVCSRTSAVNKLTEFQNFFDTIFMLEVGEYLPDPQEALINIWVLLKEGGTFYSSWPTLYCLHNPYEIDYIRYSKKYLELLFDNARLKIQDIIPRKMTKGRNAYAEFIRQEGLHPVKHTDDVYDLGYIIKATK